MFMSMVPVTGMGGRLGKSGDVTDARHSYSPISDTWSGEKLNVRLSVSLTSMMMFRSGPTS